MNNNRTVSVALLLGLVPAVVSPSVFASAFQLMEQNTTHLGSAYSGAGVGMSNVSSAYYNPATLKQVEEKEVVQSLILVNGVVEATATSSLSNTGTAVSGRTEDNPGGLAGVPAMHYGARIDDDLVFGLTISPPYGTKTEYRKDSSFRYAASKSDLKVFNIGSALAYQYSPKWTWALGFDAAYVQAQLNARIGTGAVSGDGFQKNFAQDWGYGWHAGVLYEHDDDTRAGLSYRSKMHFVARGESKSLVGGLSQLQDVSSAVTLPESVIASVYHRFLDDWAAMIDYQWVRWQRIDKLELEYESLHLAGGAERRTVTITEVPLHFRNTSRWSLGFEHYYDKDWTFRVGGAWDPSPTQDEYRTARIPDADRVWVAAGATYQWSDDLKVDLGYAHLFFDDVTVNDSGPVSTASGLNVTSVNLQANFHTHADLLGIQISYKFM